MATASAVTIFAQISNTAAVVPVGNSASCQLTYTDGDTALDNPVLVAVSSTALNADIVGPGFMQVVNPAFVGGVANTVSVNILCNTTAMGPLPPGATCLLPLASGTVYKATVASGTLLVGVTVCECSANA
jgi:hypothetical protein